MRSSRVALKVHLIASSLVCNTLALHSSLKIMWRVERNGETNSGEQAGIQSGLHLVWREDSRKRERRFVWNVLEVFLHDVGSKVAHAKARCGW